MNKDDRAKALELALAQIKKDFGQEALMKLGEKAQKSQVLKLFLQGYSL